MAFHDCSHPVVPAASARIWWQRAATLAGVALLALSAACAGGGGGGTDHPVPPASITSFSAAQPNLVVGDATTLTAVFSGGTAAIDQGIGPVATGVSYPTNNLTADTTFTLTVTPPSGPAASAAVTVTVMPAASLDIAMTGLPVGLGGLVEVFGPLGFSQTVGVAASLTGLFPGTYTLVPSGVWGTAGEAGQVFQATGGQAVTLAPGGSANATVAYASVPSLTLQIPDGSNPGTTVPLALATLQAGTFQMGAYGGEEDGNADETPQHPVTLSRPVLMAEYLTTQAQWKAVMGSNPSNFCVANEGTATDDFSRPVETVSWNDTTTFLGLLNTATAATRPAGTVFRLPTEAEWEYACRADSATRFYWGDDPDGTIINQYAWWSGNSLATTQPVGSKGAGSANAFGLFDMSGNVFEWCGDWYGPFADGPQTDPTGPASGTFRVVRGGSWYHGVIYCRSANRSYSGPDDKFSSIGFRVVLAPA